MKKNNKIKTELASFVLAATLLNTTAFAGFLPVAVEKINNISNKTESEKILSEIEAKEQAQLSNSSNYIVADITMQHTETMTLPAYRYAGPVAPDIKPVIISPPAMLKYAGPELIVHPKYAGPETVAPQIVRYAGPVLENDFHSIVRYAGPEMMAPQMVRYAGPEMITPEIIAPQMVRYAGPEINTQINTQVESIIARYAGPAAPVLTPVMVRYAGPEAFEIQYTMPRYAGPVGI